MTIDQQRLVTQLARAPHIARVVDKFIKPPAGLAVGLAGTTYSMYYGWGGGMYWKCDLVSDSSEPGGYTLHQLRNQSAVAAMLSRPYGDAAVTSSGTWNTGLNVSAYNGGYAHSTTAGSYKETTLPLGATSAALRVPLATNGGRWIKVTIDGDATKADLLLTAQEAVDKNWLDATDLVANGGTLNPTDRVFDSYASSVGTTNWGGVIPLAAGLDPAVTHTVRATVTASVRKGIVAPNDRAYFSGFSYGSATIGLTDASTIIVSVGVMNAVVSAWEHAAKTKPSGASTAVFLGNVHGYEQELGFTLKVDGATTTLTDGQIVTAKQAVVFTRTGQMFHPETGSTKIADTEVIYTMSRAGLELAPSITWAVIGDVSASYAMLPVEGAASNTVGATKFTRGALLDYAGGTLTFTGATETDTYLGHSKSAAAWVWGGKFGALIHVPDVETYTNDWQWANVSGTRVEDRNLAAGGRITKFYIPRHADATETVAAGDVHSYRSQILFSYFPGGAEATLAAL